MESKNQAKMVKAALRLVDCRANDAVLLAFLEPKEAMAALPRLDLTMLESLERTPTGGCKVKMLDRIAALQAAYGCLERADTGGGTAAFLAALGGETVED